jgi:hypothetical protein
MERPVPEILRNAPFALALVCTLAASRAANAFDPFAKADPAVAIRDFNETCAKGFPDLDAVERVARASGWRQSEIQGPADIASQQPPRIFNRDGTLLFLIHPTSGPFKVICQVTGSGQTKLTGADLAAMATPALNAGTPAIEKTREKDAAVYTTGPGLSIEARIDIYHKSRSITLSAQQVR